MDKKTLRRDMAALPPLSPDEKRAMDRGIYENLFSLPELSGKISVFSYVGVGSEPDTRAILGRFFEFGCAVSVPRCKKGGAMDAVRIPSLSELSPAPPYGIPEPPETFPSIDPASLDVILVPGVAFSLSGERLGHGAGYYDRFFERTDALRVALSYERTLLPTLPTDAHDKPVHILVTEKRVIRL